jgi:hypothetical protein
MKLPMKLLRTAGLCLVAMLVMSMVAAGTASAAPHWLVCLPEHSGTTTTKWSSSQCTGVGTGWEWSELKGTEAGRVVNQTLTLKDLSIAGVATEIQCAPGTSEGEGFVGPGKFGKITKAKIKEPKTNCTRIAGACLAGDVEVVEGIHLPWQTELIEAAGKILSVLVGGGAEKTEPGWKITCKTATGKITDECESEPGKEEELLLANVATGTELLVLGTFEKLHKAKCTLSNANPSGEVEGSVAILVVGRGLRVSS